MQSQKVTSDLVILIAVSLHYSIALVNYSMFQETCRVFSLAR
jgi:hypothetical protein